MHSPNVDEGSALYLDWQEAYVLCSEGGERPWEEDVLLLFLSVTQGRRPAALGREAEPQFRQRWSVLLPWELYRCRTSFPATSFFEHC